jgi:hypothetical protein
MVFPWTLAHIYLTVTKGSRKKAAGKMNIINERR